MLKLKGISVVYNVNTAFEKKILDNISLSVTKGQSVAIKGDNGAGKSTLVKVIAGEIQPIHGKIIINNKDYTKKNIVQRSHMIGRVFQDSMIGVALEMTILEHMLFASMRGKSRQLQLIKVKNKHDFFIERLSELNMGLEEKLDLQVKYLSGGQRQALSLIMALLSQCNLLILDEYTSALDAKTAKTVLEIAMSVVRKYNVTTLMITHDVNEAAMCDKILEIKNGRIYEDGIFDDLDVFNNS